MTRNQIADLDWSNVGSPLIEPRGLSPLVADPSFLFPEECHDGRWHLVAHSAFGLGHYSSDNGLSWDWEGQLVAHAMRGFIRIIDGVYHLYYEKYRPFGFPMLLLPIRPRWKSRIEFRTSTDLVHWSTPRVLVQPDQPMVQDARWGKSVSNPCLVKLPEGGYRLYWSAGLVHVPDCGFEEPRFIAAGTGPSPAGPFPGSPSPIIDPEKDALDGVMGAGSMKVVVADGGWVGFQNKIYTDSAGKSRSAIFLLWSDDGLVWEALTPVHAKVPLIGPSSGWTSTHVYACDARHRRTDGLWYVYFNARDGWLKSEGKERIGRIVSRD